MGTHARAASSLAVASALFLALGAANAADPGRTSTSDSATRGLAAPAAASFEPLSASFSSARTGFVLGVRGCGRLPCPARLVMTGDGGKTWTPVTAPAVPAGGQDSRSVTTVRFAGTHNGWLFGPALWATHDGGRHWRRIRLHGQVSAVAASMGTAFASVFPSGGGPSQLYRSQVGTDRWTRVPGVQPDGALTLSGRAGWAGTSPHLWATSDQRRWHRLSFRCPAPYTDSSSLAAAAASDVTVLCAGNGAAGGMGKLIFRSGNGGRTFMRVGKAPFAGLDGTIAIPPNRPLTITLATSSSASMLDWSVDGGRSWHVVRFDDGGLGWRDLAYASATTGWIVHGSQPVFLRRHELMVTREAGITWHAVAIP